MSHPHASRFSLSMILPRRERWNLCGGRAVPRRGGSPEFSAFGVSAVSRENLGISTWASDGASGGENTPEAGIGQSKCPAGLAIGARRAL